MHLDTFFVQGDALYVHVLLTGCLHQMMLFWLGVHSKLLGRDKMGELTCKLTRDMVYMDEEVIGRSIVLSLRGQKVPIAVGIDLKIRFCIVTIQ